MPATVKAKKKGPSEVFGDDEVVELENGSRVRVTKWSVRKAMAMGKSLAKVLQKVFAAVEARGEKGVHIADVIGMIPVLMDECADELVFIISESLTTEDGPQITPEAVFDTLTLEDFTDVLRAIIARNITERLTGKLARLLQGLPLLTATEPEPKRNSTN